MKIKIQILILIILPALPAFSQFSGFPDITPRPPEPATLKPDIRIGIEPSSSRGYSYPGIRHPHHTDTYDYDSEILHRRNLINRKIIEEATAHIKERENAMKLARQLLDHGFPSWAREKGTACFYSAFDELCGMLHDSLPMNLGRAIFITENAFLENTMNYNAFEASLQKRIDLCNWKLNELKKKTSDDFTKNAVLYSLMTDTFTVCLPGTEKQIIHYPVQYNLDDYRSEKNFTSHFITTLLATNRGQCHSMPLLYMILAERLGTEAYLSFAPHHSLVKIRGNNGEWYNLEITCRYILSDYHYMNHSFIKTEAIRSGLYLSALDKKETLASIVALLGRYYLLKYGYDPFILKCAEEAKKYMKVPLDALILEANYETRLTMEVARLLNIPTPQAMREMCPEAYKHYEHMQEIYRKIDDTGYENIPPEVYDRWLKHIEQEKEKEKRHPRSPFIQIIK